MKKKLKTLLSIFLITMMLSLNIQVVSADTYTNQLTTISDTTVYVRDSSSQANEYTTNALTAPVYFIYPDKKLTNDEASQLLVDLGIVDHIDDNATKAYVINPQGDDYTPSDQVLFLDLLDQLGSTMNTKVIGIGKGATFVNQYISQKDWGIAGIMVYGGEVGEIPAYSVPTYVSGSEKIATPYITKNQATDKTTNGNLIIYTNPNNEFEKVVVNSAEETLSQAFSNAWSNIFVKNMRIGNITGTFYSMKMSQERDFEYFSYLSDENDDFTRNVVKADLDNDGEDSLWYEYLPNNLSAQTGSVPLVILLHGNGNDPRTQPEASGWVQLGCEEGFICVAPEWQGTVNVGGKTYDALTQDDSSTNDNDIITMINQLLEKYPQIDSTRIYVEGLSRGGLNSTNIALTNSKVFAAMGSHSCGTMSSFYDILDEVVDANKDDIDMPYYFIAGTKDHFIPISDYGEDSEVLKTIQLYEELNEISVNTYDDVETNSSLYFGISLDNAGYIDNEGSCQVYGGTLSNENGVMMSLNAIENWGHWNYEPAAKMMWNFFKHYSRVDGVLYVDGKSTKTTTSKETEENNTSTDINSETVDTKNNTSGLSTANKQTKSVKTGDDTMIYLTVILLLASTGGLIYFKKSLFYENKVKK